MKERTASDTNSSNLPAINPVSSLFLQSHSIWKATPDSLSAEETFDSYENALEIGFLDTTPNAKTYTDVLGVGERKDVYRFELQSASLFELSLHGFKANADLVLQNSARHTISNSSNLASASEFISTKLEPGIYYVVVFSPNQSNTNYQLSLSADFIADDEAITTLEDSLRDPEYDQVGLQVTWRDTEGNLWVAPADPQTGSFLLERAIQVDTGVAPSDVNSGGTGNGPEWVYGQGGSRIVYTKLLDPDPDRQFDRTNWYIARAAWNGSEWEAEFILDAEGEPIPGFIPFGTLNPEDEAPLIKYVGTDPNTGESVASFWRELDDPNVGGELPEGAGRWVQGEGERSVVRNINNQIYKYDVDTEILTQITFSDTKKQGSFFMWEAPEFDNELVLMTPEIEVAGSEPLTPEPTQLGIYRQIEGEWTQIYTIESPSQDLPYFHSPEPFIYNGNSYISFLAVDTQPDSDRKNFEGAEVWIVGVDPDNPFARQLSDEENIGRNDPESLITEAGAFIYYSELTEDRGRIIHRADTGLGLPEAEASVSNSIEITSEPTVDREIFQDSIDRAGNNRQDARIIGLIDSLPASKTFSDRVWLEDRQDFYRFDLQTTSKLELSLNGLTANADVFLQDAGGHLIISSSAEVNTSEFIFTELEAGTYYVLVRSSDTASTDYQLKLTLSVPELLPPKSPTLTYYVIPPQDTNSEIDNWLDPHYVAIDEGVPANNKLFLFFSGNNSQPLNQQLITQEAAELGYHAINLSYPSSPPVGNVCEDTTDLECYEQVRLEVLDGIDRTDLVNVTPANSIEGRLVELLQYLDRQYPDKGWGAYLEGDTPDWNSIVVSGHSQGGGYALMVGKEHEMERVVTFAAQIDENQNLDRLAPWLSEPFATPAERIYEFVHLQDPRFDRHPQLWDILGTDELGEVINVDETEPPYDNSHTLVTELAPIEGGSPHGSVVTDRSTPKLPDGTPVYEEVWQYLLSDSLTPSSDSFFLVPTILDTASEPNNNRRNAFNIGILDLNPLTQNFSERVGTDDRRDFYRFELENASKFQLSLTGLSANADVFIQDAAGNLVASSTNKANSPEIISTNLDSGSYYVLVQSIGQRNTSYDLTLKAQFITNVVELDLGGRKVPDPEFDQVGFQVTWQDEVGRGTEAEKKRRLWVAPVDRQTGDILFDQALQLDNNLAPNAPISSGNATGNGPEWVYAEGGSQILYTKQVEPFGPQGWRVGRAQQIDGEWVAAPLNPELEGGAPNGSKTPNDPNPLFNYFFKDEEDNRFMAWRELNNPDNGGIVPFPFTSGARWVPEERFFVSTTATEDVNQVVMFAPDTETVTQLTFDPGVVKDKPQMWHAPEFNNELIFFAIESDATSPKRQDRLGIYRNIDGEWQRIKTIDPPSDLPIIDSPEHFVYNNKSYIVMATVPEQGQGSQLWLAGIDPEDNLYRQISNPEEETASTDPEPFITDEGAFIYYAKGGGSQLFRADTGLGAPIADTNSQDLAAPDLLNFSNLYGNTANFNANLDTF